MMKNMLTSFIPAICLSIFSVFSALGSLINSFYKFSGRVFLDWLKVSAAPFCARRIFSRKKVLSLLVILLTMHSVDSQAGVGNPTSASFNSQSVPVTMEAGRSYDVSISMMNNGSAMWDSSDGFALGTQSAQGDGTWEITRVDLPQNIDRDGSIDLSFRVRAPSTPGKYSFRWRMIHYETWFGAFTPEVIVTVVAPQSNSSQIVSVVTPNVMVTGVTYPVSVTFKNIGSTTWSSGAAYSLGALSPNDQIWGVGRVALAYAVPPGAQYTFNFNVAAPAPGPYIGSYEMQWKMVQDGVEWFGDTSSTLITVNKRTNNSQLVEQIRPPQVMETGLSYPASITLRNNGNTTWRSGELYSLGMGIREISGAVAVESRVALTRDIVPGDQYTFSYSMVAPSPGTYTAWARMVQDGVEWFGESVATPVGVNPRAVTPVNVSALMAVLSLILEDDTPPPPPPVPPTIQLSGPAAGSIIAPGSVAAFSVTTGGPAPAAVQLYANGNLIGVAKGDGEAWTFNWAAGQANTYSVIAKSFDSRGFLLVQSAPVVVAVSGSYQSSAALPMSYPPVFKSVTREVSYEYYPANGLLYRKHVEPNNAQSRLDSEYAYDGFGNASISMSSAAIGSAAIKPRAEGPGYDSVGRFPTSYVNTLSQKESREFSAEFGQITSVTDINQDKSSARYDEFGRKTAEVHADGTQLKIEYFYCSANGGTVACPTYAAYVVQSTPLGVSGNQIGPVTKVYLSALDKEIKTEEVGFDGSSVISVSTEYDKLGLIYRKSRPYYANKTIQWVTTYYDSLNRLSRTVQPDSSTVTLTYDGSTTTTTNSLNQQRKEVSDDLGRVVTVVDNAGKSMSLRYDGFGNLLRTTDSDGNSIQLVYDVRGNKVQMFDPDMGIWNYEYDVLGNLTRRADSKVQVTTFAYDLGNRMTSRSEQDMVATYSYDGCKKGVGRMCSVTSDNGYERKIDYDNYGRHSQTKTVIDDANKPYAAGVSYDPDTGRVATQTYPNGLSVSYRYTSLGYLSEVRNTSNNSLYWKANEMDAENHIVQATYGNDIITKQVFDARTGFVKSITAGVSNSVQGLSFDYDTVGNVRFRSDLKQGLSESFYYEDGVNRLTSSALTSGGAGTLQQSYSYYDNGNVKTRSALGTYYYGAVNTQPHALTSIALAAGGTINYRYDTNGNLIGEVYKDVSGNVIATKGRTESYTSFNMPLTLSAPGGISLNYVYGPEHQRSKVTSNAGTIIYLNPDQEGGLLYEKETKGNTVEHRNFVTANGQVIAIVKQIGSVMSTSYIHRDNLGSTTAMTNESGQVIEQLAYDPFGKRRFPSGSSDTANTISSATTARGFTGHEHLESLGLIHMNGRVFDPVVSRFMSADPNVPDPSDMQSYNRYSYVRNNPLTYVDMTGFWDGADAAMRGQTVQSPRDSMATGVTDGPSRLTIVANTFKGNAAGDGTLAKQTDAAKRAGGFGLISINPETVLANDGEPIAGYKGTYARPSANSGGKPSTAEIALQSLLAFKDDPLAHAAITFVVTAKKVASDAYNWKFGDSKESALAKQDLWANKIHYANGLMVIGMLRRGGSTTNYFRGAKPGARPSLVPRPGDFKVDPVTGLVKDTHGVSIFDNAGSVLSKGFEAHQIDLNSMPETLRIIQRGNDPRHFEVVPQQGANLTPQQFINACTSIACK